MREDSPTLEVGDTGGGLVTASEDVSLVNEKDNGTAVVLATGEERRGDEKGKGKEGEVTNGEGAMVREGNPSGCSLFQPHKAPRACKVWEEGFKKYSGSPSSPSASPTSAKDSSSSLVPPEYRAPGRLKGALTIAEGLEKGMTLLSSVLLLVVLLGRGILSPRSSSSSRNRRWECSTRGEGRGRRGGGFAVRLEREAGVEERTATGATEEGTRSLSCTVRETSGAVLNEDDDDDEVSVHTRSPCTFTGLKRGSTDAAER